MAEVAIDVSHDCEHGDDATAVGGAVALHQAARSSCHGAILAEGGTDEAGYHCTECGEPCEKVMGDVTAHWTCLCGTQRKQVITVPEDVAPEGTDG